MDNGTHAKPGDVLVGRLSDPIGMWRDEVYLRDLSPEAQALLKAAMAYEQPQLPDGGDFGESDLHAAARAFAKSMGVKRWHG